MSVSGRSHPKQTADSPSLSTCTLPPPPACLHWILCVRSCSCAVNAVSPWILLKSTAILQNLFLAGSVSWSSLPCECTSWYKAGDGKVWLGLHLTKKNIYIDISYCTDPFCVFIGFLNPSYKWIRAIGFFLKGKCQSPGDLAWAGGLLKKQRKDGVGRSLPNGPATRALLP